MNMKFNGKSKSRAGRLPDNIPLIELHHYTRVSDSEPDLGYIVPTTRHIESLTSSPSPPETKRKRDKLLTLLFPERLGTIATAWRLQIEQAQMGLSIVVDPTGSVCLPRPVVYRDGWRGRDTRKLLRSTREDVGWRGDMGGREERRDMGGQKRGELRVRFLDEVGAGSGEGSWGERLREWEF